MIKFSFKKEDDKITNINVSGHSMYSKYGTDIICSSVSTAIIISVNAIKHLNLDSNIKFELKDGYFKLEVLNYNDIVNKLLENLLYSLKDLEDQYPKNIKNHKEA